jgi:hypothetical protein
MPQHHYAHYPTPSPTQTHSSTLTSGAKIDSAASSTNTTTPLDLRGHHSLHLQGQPSQYSDLEDTSGQGVVLSVERDRLMSSDALIGEATPTVFVSYAHDSPEHQYQVLRFATFLRSQGIEAVLDIWFTGDRQDWYAWAIRRMTEADYVIVVASERYRQMGDGSGPNELHKGVQSEAALLRELVYGDRDHWLSKILPVVLLGHGVNEIPLFLQPNTASRYMVKALTLEGADLLLRVILRQPGHIPPPVAAQRPVLPIFSGPGAAHDWVVEEFRRQLDGGRPGDYLDQEITRIAGALSFPLAPIGLDPTDMPAEVERRLDAYERELSRLVRMVVATVSHGDERSDGLCLRALSRLLVTLDGGRADGIAELVAAQTYPALLVSYSAGVAARIFGQDAAIRLISGQPAIIERLLPFRVVATTVVDEFPGWSSRPPAFGLSVRLRRALEPVFTENLTSAEYSTAFAEYEYLRSLVELHALDFSALGEYAVALGRGRSNVDERVAPSLTDSSSLLLAGAFDGSATIAAEVCRRLLTLVRDRFG